MEEQTRILFKRRLLIAAVIIVCALLQLTIGYFPSFFGVHFFLLVPLCVCIAIFEGERWGAAFGVFAGALWDLTHGGGDGYNALFLFAICAVCGVLVRYLMQKNIVTALVMSGGACFLYSLFYVMFFISAQGIERPAFLFVRYFLPSAVLSFLLTFVFYYMMKGISKKYAVEY
ncbi:MAG: rod shape-determining protein MreD [Clostridiales bacterium]|nr:rod shape-determining protein MreD [Clostridia bacterium]MCR4563955.1 rod shape-determining protein MreD [Clostridiales bacterium]